MTRQGGGSNRRRRSGITDNNGWARRWCAERGYFRASSSGKSPGGLARSDIYKPNRDEKSSRLL